MIKKLMLQHLFHAPKRIEFLSAQQQKSLEIFRSKLASGDYFFEKVSCLCGNQGGELVARYDRYALPINTYLCPKCGTMRTNPRLNKESLAKFYEEDYRPIYVGDTQVPDQFWEEQVQRGRSIYEFVKAEIDAAQNITVFDVGCGAGGSLIPFRDAGWSVFGCDLGGEYLRRGRSVGLTLEQGGEDSLAKYAPAHLMIYSHVLEHLPTPLTNLRRAVELLNDDGYVYVELPGILSLAKTYGDILLFLQNAHLYHFTLTTLSALMCKAGFRLVKGTELIQALYKCTAGSSLVEVDVSSQYKKIKKYLYCTEIKRNFPTPPIFARMRYAMMKTARALLGDEIVDYFKQHV